MPVTGLPIDLWVPGLPQPQGSKDKFVIRNKEGTVVGTNVVESSKAVRPWRTDVKMYAQQAIIGRGTMMTGPIAISCRFIMHRPLATPKTRPTPPATKKPDLDKLMRAIGDALKGVVYTDDSQVVEWYGSKRIAELGEQTGVHIIIGELDDRDVDATGWRFGRSRSPAATG